MKRIPLLAAVIVSFVLGAMTGGRPVSASPTKDNADALRKLEGEFMKAAAERGSAGYMAYYADDATELPNGENALEGKAAIAKTMSFLDQKDNHLTWTPTHADMAASGDLGYTYGTYVFASKDKDGKMVEDHGKYMTVWKKQKDGSWKVAVDMGNSRPAPKAGQ
jgi:ketosteroid isomerase-like protein